MKSKRTANICLAASVILIAVATSVMITVQPVHAYAPTQIWVDGWNWKGKCNVPYNNQVWVTVQNMAPMFNAVIYIQGPYGATHYYPIPGYTDSGTRSYDVEFSGPPMGWQTFTLYSAGGYVAQTQCWIGPVNL